MEKFAVDLDAVLDEFEFHEDQVNIGRREPPADMLFFFVPGREAEQ